MGTKLKGEAEESGRELMDGRFGLTVTMDN